MLVVAVPKQQLDPVLGQPWKEAGNPAGRNFQARSPVFPPQGSLGRQSSPSSPPSPSRRCQPWPGSSRHWKNKVWAALASICRVDVDAHTQTPTLPMFRDASRASWYPHSMGRVREPGGLSPYLLPLLWREDLGLRTDPSLWLLPRS